MRRLLQSAELTRSPVVANSTMNRERRLRGSNSYTRDLGLDPLAFLAERMRGGQKRVAWLNLCCGSGRALIEAASAFQSAGDADRVRIVGVDLVEMFDAVPRELACLRLECGALPGWETDDRFDLVTCVHGMHYIGDKLGLIARAASWLTEGGRFLANLDPANLRFSDGSAGGRSTLAELRRRGFVVDRYRHVLARTGVAEVRLPYAYEGADDAAGPNYTGQPAVDSFCRRETRA